MKTNKKLFSIALIVSVLLSMTTVVSFADSAINVSYGTRVEMENYFPKSDGTAGYSFDENEGFSGGRAGRAQSNLAEEYETEPVVFEVNETGMYNIRMKVCAYVGDRSTYGLQQLYYTSPFKIQIDDGDALPLSKYSGTIVHESIEALNNVWYSTIKLSAPVEFTEGETHSIKFITDGKGTNASSRFLAIDYIDFIAQSDDTYFKGEEYLPKTTANAAFSDGVAGWIDNITEDVSFYLSFYTPTEIHKKINMIAAGGFTNSEWYSPIQMQVDGGAAITISNNTCLIESCGAANWADVTTYDYYTFSPGIHTIKLSTNGAGSSQTTGQRAMGLDSLSLINSLRCEGEGVMPEKDTVNYGAYCSGGYYGSHNKKETESGIVPITATCTFYVEEAGNYDVQLIVGGDIKKSNKSKWLSPITMQINGNSPFELDAVSAGKNVTELTWAGASAGDADQMGKYSVDDIQYFNTGLVTITVSALSNAINQRNVVMWLDYVELVPYHEPVSTTIDVDSYIAIGDSSKAVIKDQGDNVIDAAYLSTFRVDTPASFSSSNTSAVTVDGNGEVDAVDYGMSNISAASFSLVSRIDGRTINVAAPSPVTVRVTSGEGIYYDSSSIAGTDLSVTYKAGKEINNATVIFAAFTPGATERFKICASKEFTNLSVGDDLTFSKTLTGISSGDIVYALIWDGVDTLKPMYDRILMN